MFVLVSEFYGDKPAAPQEAKELCDRITGLIALLVSFLPAVCKLRNNNVNVASYWSNYISCSVFLLLVLVSFIFGALRRRMEELETLERFECPECPDPPPEFRLPPPPRPPFLTEGTFCPETIPDLEDCGAFPMIDPSYHTNPSLQSTALIITCAVVLLLMAAIVSVVFWKHKRKVQNILPCKSAAGAAATAGRVRVLPDGPPMGGSTMSPGSAVLYEDLPETGGLPQLHNHLGSHHHHHQMTGTTGSTGQPTIEVRGTNHSAWQQRSKMERIPAPHHLDYLDYRDPRSILRVADKPSRAVLGGYRTPRALLAKSQGVPLSIATHVTTQTNNERASSPTGINDTNDNNSSSQSDRFNNAQNNLSRNDYYSTRSVIPDDSNYRSSSNQDSSVIDRSLVTSSIIDLPGLDEISNYNDSINPTDVVVPVRSMKLSRNRDHDYPITPTHRSRLRASPQNSLNDQPTTPTNTDDTSLARRSSVDSEGYSYIDFDDRPRQYDDPRISNNSTNRTFVSNLPDNTRNDSIDSEGYSYIDPYYRRVPGSARRVPNYGYTEEEICPLCTMQQIQNLLTRPEDTYNSRRDT